MKEIIVTGETIDIAKRNAAAQLGIDIDDLECEIIQTPVKKTFGLFGGSPAKIKAFIEDDEVDTKTVASPVVSEPIEAVKAAKDEIATKTEGTAKAVPTGTINENALKAMAYLKEILLKMGLSDVNIEATETEAGAELLLSGNDIGFIIGHRGETLDSLQYLASLVANNSGEPYYRITLDVGNYRKKRKETLEALGKKMAYKSIKTGRNNNLEPMNPYERRIIHTAVQDIEGAKSWSEGENMNRHVVVGPEGGERYPRRNNNRGGRGGYNNRRPNNNYRPHSNDGGGSKVAAKPAEPAQPKTDAPNMPLYGKIEK